MTTNKIAMLLVEDDRDTLTLTHGIISALFPTVAIHTAANPKEALELFEQHHHHILVTDHRMPEVGDGIQLARKVCEGERKTVVIIVSADDLTDVLEQTPDVDICSVLKKPVDITILRDNLRNAITSIARNQNRAEL
jgi:CheY-like chemotaxis protein